MWLDSRMVCLKPEVPFVALDLQLFHQSVSSLFGLKLKEFAEHRDSSQIREGFFVLP